MLYLYIEREMLLDGKRVKQNIMLRAQAQVTPHVRHLVTDVVSVQFGRTTRYRDEA